ncbi:MAG: patatin-like phospholipase family protein [Candidatus Omnitrophica bacterium]|nr:patatin-like phospholipase family protein [Candidatus Omnitrophota bacterium]MBU1128777.1 patatin-like phospholipase family protein [Candidatus Omnitrophota bacterium]MBU1785222.1 patatin-like phospholipase family protein [Candidatus Omnitrophota bacterium]MBU1851230.1 patatin-like phospholipase family protein [Candidatus Omnitrophota bacterium]
MRMLKKRMIALSLGGGAARGLSNVGILKELEKNFGKEKMPFDMMVGSSIGGLVGAAYCLGVPVQDIEDAALKVSSSRLVDFSLNSTGLLKGEKLEKIISKMLDGKGFNDFQIPFAVTTTDIETGEELVHTSGNLVRIVRASCSWPGFFSSTEIDGRLLADGGIRNSVPTKAAYAMGATFVVATNPGFSISDEKIDNVFKALVQSIQIMGEELNEYQAGIANVVIKPELKNIHQFDFDRARYIMARGEDAARECMKELKRKLWFHTLTG